MLERVRASDFHAVCPVGHPKTTPMGLEVRGSLSAPRASATCPRRAVPIDEIYTPCGRSRKDSLHSINPAFRLASPSPSLTRANVTQSDAQEDVFIPLP